LYGFIAGVFLNVVLAAQMLWYWNSGTKLGGGAGAKKKYYAAGGRPNKGRKKA
jgi:mannose-P-dolichol utilization defect protein 1